MTTPRSVVQLTGLGEMLRAHEADEERVLHPAMEQLLKTDADWQTLVQAVRRRGPAPL